MLNRKAREIIGYNDLVKRLAAEIPEATMENIETDDLKRMLGAGYERWEFKDWFRLIVDIRKEQNKDLHVSSTVDKIIAELPYAAQQSVQRAVHLLLRKASKNLLFSGDETVDALVDIPWYMFNCMRIDIKDTLMDMDRKNLCYSHDDLKDSKLLFDFIVLLRHRQWNYHGEVTMLDTKEGLWPLWSAF